MNSSAVVFQAELEVEVEVEGVCTCVCEWWREGGGFGESALESVGGWNAALLSQGQAED